MEFGKHKFPVYSLSAGETSFSYLWKIAFRGLENRYKPITEQAVKRLQNELEVIDEMGFSDYFLIVWDIIRESKKPWDAARWTRLGCKQFSFVLSWVY
ncbi:MAG: hypothetical protein U5K00_07780 [Melioribacteraceae bacterium]|nr:hypothetical protein [Melioribacteraceae bacterium]